jgi:hypothetical protein
MKGDGAGLQMLIRRKPVSGALRRLVYRAEPARDWEPRLDPLWERVQGSYPGAAVRDAEHALAHFAGHPKVRHHRFLVFPRFSGFAVAHGVFANYAGKCLWLDLVWDHQHSGALELLAHISGRLAAQWRSEAESLLLAGDDAAAALLADRGFRPQPETSLAVGARSPAGGIDAADLADRSYLTAADLGVIDR